MITETKLWKRGVTLSVAQPRFQETRFPEVDSVSVVGLWERLEVCSRRSVVAGVFVAVAKFWFSGFVVVVYQHGWFIWIFQQNRCCSAVSLSLSPQDDLMWDRGQ